MGDRDNAPVNLAAIWQSTYHSSPLRKYRYATTYPAAGRLHGQRPTLAGGLSYRSAIFPGNAAERALAETSKAEVQKRFADAVVYTEIRDANEFWPVEEYHQDYYLKNPVRYKYYRWNCGRDQRLKQIGGQSAPH
jgi:peptide methionine sulfoxide reductase MsrA